MHPPVPRFALAVGVVGHRPNRLPEHTRAAVEGSVHRAVAALGAAVLETRARYRAHFAPDAPGLSLVCALAEGADTMAANAARAEAIAFDVVLPFERAEYEKDFSEHAIHGFRTNLSQARTVLELSGSRADEGKSYEAAGLAVLDCTDLVIAVWDGGPSAGRGGTAELTAEAARRGMPIVYVDANGAAPTRILWAGLEAGHSTAMHIMDHPSAPLERAVLPVVDSLLRPPDGEDEQAGLAQFFSENEPRFIARQSFPLLMALFCARWPRRADFFPVTPKTLAAHAAAENPGASPLLADAFGWADAVSVYFSQTFRGTFVGNFAAMALAVIVAASSLLADRLDIPVQAFAVAELLLIVWVFFNTRAGLKHRWHERWVEPREVAERLRIALPMSMLGTRPLGPYGAAQTWTGWYVRALVRAAGLGGGKMDAARLAAAKSALNTLLQEQLQYHKTAADRFDKLNRRMKLAGEAALGLTILAIVAHLFAGNPPGASDSLARFPAHNLFTAITTGLPALGAAIFGIRIIGDFEGTASRAGRMSGQIARLLAALEKVPAGFHALRAFSHDAEAVMLGEVASWRLSAESRGLPVPG
jgi:hypothetical protein